MRDHLIVYINGKRHEVSGDDAFRSLSDFLRQRLGLTGTKIVCSEGDCGSCTVLVGRQRGERFCYQTIDSCIQFMFQLDGTHVVTIEGLGHAGALTPVQEQLIAHHGSQCGFCTPGFVVAMTGELERGGPAPDRWPAALTGNLCRCTGYSPIFAAAEALAEEQYRTIESQFPSGAIRSDYEQHLNDAIWVEVERAGRSLQLFSPTSLESALQFLADNPTAKVVAGATDVGVQLNKFTLEPGVMLDLNRVAELEGIEEEDGTLLCGARATWTELADRFRDRVPQFHEIISVFGSAQIRNAGTIGGNLANASPIADSLPFLLIMDAKLEVRSAAGSRSIDINDFYLGYKSIDLAPGELITRIRIPLPPPEMELRLLKVSRRRDLDIASFTAAVGIVRDNGHIESARLAYGAVGPKVLRLRETEAFLAGKPYSEETMREAGEVAVDEITPISDVRGTADYRYQLARNCLLKFYYESETSEAAAL